EQQLLQSAIQNPKSKIQILKSPEAAVFLRGEAVVLARGTEERTINLGEWNQRGSEQMLGLLAALAAGMALDLSEEEIQAYLRSLANSAPPPNDLASAAATDRNSRPVLPVQGHRLELPEELARGRLVNADVTVVTAGRHPRAVAAQSNGVHRRRYASQGRQAAAIRKGIQTTLPEIAGDGQD